MSPDLMRFTPSPTTHSTEYTLDEIEKDFRPFYSRVLNGEVLTVVYPSGLKVLWVPPKQCQIGFTQKKGSGSARNA